MKVLLLLTQICFLPVCLIAQTLPGDSILANERSIDRPITLHARQFRITGGYGLAILSRRYGNSGEVIRLKDEGLSGIRHRFALDVRYGVTDYIQVNAAIARSGNVVSEESRYIFSTRPEPVVSQDVTRKYSGLEDLYLGVDLRAPLRTRKIDIALTLGVVLPVSRNEPKQPGHTLETVQANGGSMDKFVYRYYYPLGQGVTLARVGGMIKYRTQKWALSARLDYQHGLQDGESFEWRHQLNDDATFEYREDPFTFRIPDANTYFVEAEYQFVRWFDLFLNLSGYTSFNGWTSPQPDVKIASPYQTSWVASPGFEIIVTPRFWIRERLNFSVAGKSYEAPFSFETSLMYNFFPFK